MSSGDVDFRLANSASLLIDFTGMLPFQSVIRLVFKQGQRSPGIRCKYGGFVARIVCATTTVVESYAIAPRLNAQNPNSSWQCGSIESVFSQSSSSESAVKTLWCDYTHSIVLESTHFVSNTRPRKYELDKCVSTPQGKSNQGHSRLVRC